MGSGMKAEQRREKGGTPAGMRDAFKKTTTEMLVLFMLRQKPMYVYEMAQEVQRLTAGVLTYNTLYLAVYRLQAAGCIEEAEKRIEDGRARIYLGITAAGRAYYEQLYAEYRTLTAALDGLLARDGALYGEESQDV